MGTTTPTQTQLNRIEQLETALHNAQEKFDAESSSAWDRYWLILVLKNLNKPLHHGSINVHHLTTSICAKSRLQTRMFRTTKSVFTVLSIALLISNVTRLSFVLETSSISNLGSSFMVAYFYCYSLIDNQIQYASIPTNLHRFAQPMAKARTD